MADALESLVFGVRRVFSSLVELPTRAKLTFKADDFDVIDDADNATTLVSVKAKAATAHERKANAVIGTAYTISATNDFHLSVQGTGVVVTLPLLPVAGDRYEVKSFGAGNSLAGNGKNIDGQATYTMIDRECVGVHYNGTQWELL